MPLNNQDILSKFKVTEYEDIVKFVYDGWLAFSIVPASNAQKMKMTLLHDANTQKSLDWDKGYGPIVHVAYKVAWKTLIEKKRPQNQLGLDI
jgi:hypothetical protein